MSSTSESRNRKHRKERIAAWAIMLLLLVLVAVGFVFAYINLKEPVKQAVENIIPVAEEPPAEEEPEELPEEVTEEKALDEETLDKIFEDEPEEIPETISGNAPEADDFVREASEIVDSMSLEQKTAQLFFVKPESLTGVDVATAAGEKTRLALADHPVGGVILFKQNILDPKQLLDMTNGLQRLGQETAGVPLFIGVDEEGGKVLRLASNPNFTSDEAEDAPVKVTKTKSMAKIGKTGDPEKAYEAGNNIGTYLNAYGINLDMAPVVDVCDAEAENGIGGRSFGEDPQLVADMSSAYLKGLNDANVTGVLKHFPGLGSSASDTHDGSVVCDKDWDQLKECDLIPFEQAITEGADMIMVSHVSLPALTGDEVPASMSAILITQKLRLDMGFTGIIITDALDMKAVTGSYDSAAAAVSAIGAGADMLLMPADFEAAYNGVLEAVKDGSISEERISESARRIVARKLRMQERVTDTEETTDDR